MPLPKKMPKKPLTSAERSVVKGIKEALPDDPIATVRKAMPDDPIATVRKAMPDNPVTWGKSRVRSTAKSLVKDSVTGEAKELRSSLRERKNNRTSEAKRRSDAIYNERRRAKRLVQKLKVEMTFQKGRELKATKQFVNFLQREIEKTYAPRKGTRRAVERQGEAVRTLERFTSPVMQLKEQRQAAIFRHQISLASKGHVTTFGNGIVGRGKVQIFLRQTQDIWQGLPVSERLRAIEAAYGYAPIEEIFDAIMEANQLAVEVLESEAERIKTTEENAFFYGDAEVDKYKFLDLVDSRVFIAL